MKASIRFQGSIYEADLLKPLDVSIPLRNGRSNPNAFHAPDPEFSPVQDGDFTGAVEAGSPVNFFNVRLNPHGNGTHTECVGHISKEKYTINQCLQQFHFVAELISLETQYLENDDKMLLKKQFTEANIPDGLDALLVRSLPNNDLKKQARYSGNNPPYIQHEALTWIREKGIKHFLTDFPSVDREEDGGKLSGHKAFWNYPQAPREDATITEMIYVPNYIKDGLYLLNIQIASLELDASPSKVVLFEMQKGD